MTELSFGPSIHQAKLNLSIWAERASSVAIFDYASNYLGSGALSKMDHTFTRVWFHGYSIVK